MEGGEHIHHHHHHHQHTYSSSSEHHHHHHHHNGDESDFEKAHKRRMERKFFVKAFYVFLCILAVLILIYVAWIYNIE